MTRVLVTGASGFVGRQCLPLLLAKGYEVHATSRQKPMLISQDVLWHESNLLELGSPRHLISQVRPEYLLHLAWYAVPADFWEARENVDWVRASLDLFCAFADCGGRRLVAAGSCSEYKAGAGKCEEHRTALLPTTLYGTSKHALERILCAWSRQVSLSSAWGRVFYLYGPHEHPSRLVAYVVRSLLRGEPALCSEGQQVLDFLHIEDVASAFVSLLESDTQGAVNIGSGTPVAVREVLHEIGRQLGCIELIRFGARPDASRESRLWASNKKLETEVRWAPRYTLPSGIEQTIRWWRSFNTALSSLTTP